MIKFFVFDTNVLISASIRKDSVSRKALDKAMLTGTVVRSSDTFPEFATRLVRPKFDKYLNAEEKVQAIAGFKRGSKWIDVTESIVACADPDDDKFLELAVAVNAECIVSGDPHLRVLHPFRGIPIVSPADFLKMF